MPNPERSTSGVVGSDPVATRDLHGRNPLRWRVPSGYSLTQRMEFASGRNPLPPFSPHDPREGVGMSRIFGIAVLPFLLLGCAPAPEQSESAVTIEASSNPSPTGGPFIKHAVGAVFREETPRLEMAIPVKNCSDRPIRFTKVIQTCSCAGAELAKMELAAGEATVLRLVAILVGRSGPQLFQCQLVEESGPLWMVQASATVYEAARASVPSVVFGMLDPGQHVSKALLIQYFAKHESLLPTSIRFVQAPRQLGVTIGQPRTAQDDLGIWRREWPLDATIAAAREPGAAQELIELVTDQSGFREPVRVTGQWCVRSLYAVSPPTVFFPAMTGPSADKRTKIVTIKSREGSAKLKSIAGALPGITVESAATADPASIQLMVTVESQVRHRIWCELRVVMDDPFESVVKVPVAAGAGK